MESFSKQPLFRIGILFLLVVVNFLLFRVLLTQHLQLIQPTKNFLDKISPRISQTLLGDLVRDHVLSVSSVDDELSVDSIITGINQERVARKLPELESSQPLAQAGKAVVSQLEKNGGDFDTTDADKIITTTLMQKRVTDLTLFHDTVIGPETLSGLFRYWNTAREHQDLISSPDLTQIGIATGSVQLEGKNQGIVVAIFGKPQIIRTEEKQKVLPAQQKKIVLPEISNQSVFDALNLYRNDHKVHPLVEDSRLCQYAEKRVKDLIAFGGLDEHAGFKKDFADQNNLPAPIKEYPGGAIGENLAYQYCKNMTTGDDFIAQTATSLIEWCFDSSTKGHREAQLNPRYNAVCARHQDGYFVIIFGE